MVLDLLFGDLVVVCVIVCCRFSLLFGLVAVYDGWLLSCINRFISGVIGWTGRVKLLVISTKRKVTWAS